MHDSFKGVRFFFSLRLTEMNWRVNSQLWSEKHLSLCTVICWVKGILFWYKWQKNVVYVCSLQTFNPGLELNSLLYLTSLKNVSSFFPVSFYTTLLSLPSNVSCPAVYKAACLYWFLHFPASSWWTLPVSH